MHPKYQERIDLAIKFIEANLSQTILLKDVANASHFSEYHFHRIFRGIMNETINDYISRRRLERSVCMLAFDKKLSITEIALRNGFSSSANFSKAIKNYFGYSPSEIRQPAKIKRDNTGKIFSKNGKVFNPSDLYPDNPMQNINTTQNLQDLKMQVDIINLEPQTIVTLPSSKGYELASIYSTWDTIIHWAERQGISRNSQKRFGLCYDNPAVTAADKCRYESAIVIEPNVEIESPFKSSLIPGGEYATQYFEGQPEKAQEAHLNLYSHWLPSNGYEPDHFPLLENYLNDVREDGFVKIMTYIKLKPLK